MSKELLRTAMAAAAAALVCGLLLAVPLRIKDTPAVVQIAEKPRDETLNRIVLLQPVPQEEPPPAELTLPAPAFPEPPDIPDSAPVSQAEAPAEEIQQSEIQQSEIQQKPPAEIPAGLPEPETAVFEPSSEVEAAHPEETVVHGILKNDRGAVSAGAVKKPHTAVPAHEDAPTPPIFQKAAVKEPISPVYPRKAREKGIQGTVLLRLQVDAEGLVRLAEIGVSSGSDLLDTAALKAVREAQFFPASEGGKPVASEILVPIRFVLGDTPGR